MAERQDKEDKEDKKDERLSSIEQSNASMEQNIALLTKSISSTNGNNYAQMSGHMAQLSESFRNHREGSGIGTSKEEHERAREDEQRLWASAGGVHQEHSKF